MFPVLVIAIGIAVLLFGKRLAVLGAAIGALLGVGLISLVPGASFPWLSLAVPIILAAIGFFVAGFAKGIVNIILFGLGALAGIAIVLGFLDLFNTQSAILNLILAAVGGLAGFILVRRYKDLALVILAGLVGGLLVTRGLTEWLPVLEGALGSLVVIVLAVASIVYQGGFLSGSKSAQKTS
jgi:hypothetical protein